MIETLRQDLRFGLRMLARQPGFAAVAILTLAIGIGANSALFSLVHRVLLSDLPFAEPDRLVMLRETDLANNISDGSVSGPNFVDWQAGSRSFEAMTACQFGCKFNLSGEGEPVSLTGALVTPGFSRVFGTSMALGRMFREEDSAPGSPDVVILSHGIWQRLLGGAPDIVGRTLTLDGKPHVVVGVVPPMLGFIEEMIEVYVPMPDTQIHSNRGGHYLQVFGRLKAGATREQALEELRVIAAAIGAEHPDQTGRSVRVDSLHERLVDTVRPAFLVLYAAVGLVLLIACANVANLLLARGQTRHREMAIRGSLGAERGRIVRQLLTESVLLALGGAALGLLLARFGLDLLQACAPRLSGRAVPFFEEIGLDGAVLGFTLAIAVVTGLVFGLVPALHLTRPNLVGALKEAAAVGTGSRRHHRTLSTFVVSQLALSVVLLTAAGLLVRNLVRLSVAHPGFESGELLTLQTELPHARYTNDILRLQFYRRALEEVRILPGVKGADVVNLLPMGGADNGWSFDIEGEPPLPAGRYRLAEYRLISPGFLQTMGIPLRLGRGFDETDDGQGRNVAMVSESLVQLYFPDGRVLGQRIKFGMDAPWMEIVGVVGDVKLFGLAQAPPLVIYQPITQDCWHMMSLVVRTQGDPMALARPVREAIWRVNPDQAVSNVRRMDDWVSDSISVERFSASLLSGFALAGLLLAAIGIYGVLAYTVNQRTHEIGVRMALGAGMGEVLRLVLGRGMRLTGAGLLLGVAAALAVAHALRRLLSDMEALDPLTFVVVVVVLAAVCVLACYLPARRAARVDPMVALRNE